MDARRIREALISAIPEQNIGVPAPRFIYTPRSHDRALHPDNSLVRGIRGAGKSLWWSVLQSPYYPELLRLLLGRGRVPTRIDVTPGFGETPDPDRYPGRDTLDSLVHEQEPRLIWRTIVLGQVATPESGWPQTWGDRVAWVKRRPEDVERLLYAAETRLRKTHQMHLVVFDALERTASSWEGRTRLLDGLLENLLEFRAYQGIRLKAFVRPDMLVAPDIGRFPDASKILAGPVDLRWPRNELFGLLWQYLANAPEGDHFRRQCHSAFDQLFRRVGSTWCAPDAMNSDEKVQRKVFEALSGPWMGRDRRRGFPYTWLPSHLMDAHEQTSPRSFLAAVRMAAEDSAARYGDHTHALYYEAIKRGVQQASRIRVKEVTEDYPWLDKVMKPLEGLKVPCQLAEIAQRWKRSRLEPQLDDELRGVMSRRSGEFALGLCSQLIEIGIFQRMPDGRINLPDVYRVGFGLLRLGGVKPLK